MKDAEFKTGLEKHLEQTQRHVTNVERVFAIIGETPLEEECIAFEAGPVSSPPSGTRFGTK